MEWQLEFWQLYMKQNTETGTMQYEYDLFHFATLKNGKSDEYCMMC